MPPTGFGLAGARLSGEPKRIKGEIVGINLKTCIQINRCYNHRMAGTDLTPLQEDTFWHAMLRGLPVNDAARQAGSRQPEKDAARIMGNKQRAAVFRGKVKERILVEGAGGGVALMINVMHNTSYHIKFRMDAAKFLIQAAAMLPKAPDAPASIDSSDGKALHEMNREELRQIVESAEDILLSHAKHVKDVPNYTIQEEPAKLLDDLL